MRPTEHKLRAKCIGLAQSMADGGQVAVYTEGLRTIWIYDQRVALCGPARVVSVDLNLTRMLAFTLESRIMASLPVAFGPRRHVPFQTVHRAFIHHALRAPDSIALIDLSREFKREVSYDTLLRYAQFIALRLQQNGVRPGSKIALVAKRGVEMVAGVLGILMTGAQYIPLDGGVVADQTLEHAITESRSAAALCDDAFCSRLQPFDSITKPLVLQELVVEAERVGFKFDPDRLICEGDGNSGCYLIYTSGIRLPPMLLAPWS